MIKHYVRELTVRMFTDHMTTKYTFNTKFAVKITNHEECTINSNSENMLCRNTWYPNESKNEHGTGVGLQKSAIQLTTRSIVIAEQFEKNKNVQILILCIPFINTDFISTLFLPVGLSKPLSSLLLLSFLLCSSSLLLANLSRSLCLSWHLAKASPLSFSRAASLSSLVSLLSLSLSLSLSLESRLSFPRFLSIGLLSLPLDLVQKKIMKFMILPSLKNSKQMSLKS